MKLDALDHPKTFDLASRLRVSLPTAIGHLELLWAFTGKQAPQGNIGKWPNGAIARACFWDSDPQQFIDSLVLSGFVDEDEKYRYLIHDWPEHAPRWVKSKLKTLGISFISSAEPKEGAEDEKVPPTTSWKDKEGDAVDDTSRDVSNEAQGDTKCSEGKGREGKPKPEVPAWVDPFVWAKWENFRREIRKPLTPRAHEAQIEFLEKHQADHVEIIEQSIRCSWTGLFPLKNGAHHAPHQRTDNSAPARVARAVAERERQRNGGRIIDAERSD